MSRFGETWANPSGFRNIRLSDPSGYYLDGTVNGEFYPIGGSGGVAEAMTLDGLHPSFRGAAYHGYCIWQAAQGFLGGGTSRVAATYSAEDGYDPLYNPGEIA